MARSDYAHHNEDADMIWWQEEGRHSDEPEYCDSCGFAHGGSCPDVEFYDGDDEDPY